jgi:hypothetical protein
MKGMVIVAVLCMVASLSALAGEQREVRSSIGEVTYVIPAGSPVGEATPKEYDIVEYEGRILVSGDYEYGYETDDPSDTDNYGEKILAFTLDQKSVALLPYWDRDGRVANELVIDNPDVFVRALIPREQLLRLESRKINSIRGTASIWVDRFQTHVECDHQYDSATFSSVVEAKYVAFEDFAEEPGC